MASDYKSDLEQAREQLAKLFHQRSELEIAIAKQQKKVGLLASLADESEETDQVLDLGLSGLTNAVRAVFMAAGDRPLLAIEVRDRLKELRFPVTEYQNVLAAIHTTLRRMYDNGELDEAHIASPGGSGPVGYRWKRLSFGQKIGRGRFGGMEEALLRTRPKK